MLLNQYYVQSHVAFFCWLYINVSVFLSQSDEVGLIVKCCPCNSSARKLPRVSVLVCFEFRDESPFFVQMDVERPFVVEPLDVFGVARGGHFEADEPVVYEK